MQINKFGFCKVSISPIRKENFDQSEMVSQLLFGEVFELIEIQNNWSRILTLFDNYEGWIDTKHLIFISEKELNKHLNGLSIQTEITKKLKTPWGNQIVTRGAFIPRLKKFSIGNYEFEYIQDFMENKFKLDTFAKSYLNSPYLWGGKSPFGIDCSGFTQQVFRLIDKNLPRDAFQQAENGQEIVFKEMQEGDLAFFCNSSQKINHVGIILKSNKIIHASGYVKIDVLRKDGIYSEDSKTHHLKFIKRI
jgi:hypothetical protein